MKNLIRGGQTSLHSFHMSTQLVFTLVKVGLMIVLIGDLFYVFNKFDLQNIKEISIYFLAKLFVVLGIENFQFTFSGRFGDIYHLKASAIVSNLNLVILKNNFLAAIFYGFWVGFLSATVLIIGLIFLFNFRGKKLAKEKFIRGGKIVSKRKLKKIIEKANLLELGNFFRKSYQIAKIPFPKDAEFLHTIILGSTGTGKTSAILDLIDQIRKNGDRAIIYDKMGSYTATYYDPKKDIILNPLDARSKSWSFFSEIRRESDYDYIASAFIPEKKDSSGPFWTDSARRVFAVFAKKLKEEKGEVTNKEFGDALLKSNYKLLAHYLAGTEASSLISAESEKTSLSILAILAAYISSIKYLHDDPKENFSIRNWIESDSGDQNGFLFISSKGDQHESLKPLISTWLDIAVKSLLSVEQNQPNGQDPRRIWIILDEVGSLQALPSLLDGLAQSRQFGGAFVVSLHSISQLKAIYGRDTTDTITSLCRNKLFFAGADDETSDFCSQNLGHQEVEEVKEGISYGVSEIRDGVNLNTHKSIKRLVIASQIMFMKKLQAYIKFAGDFPISKISFKVKSREKISQKFIEKQIDEKLIAAVDELATEIKPIPEARKSSNRKRKKKKSDISHGIVVPESDEIIDEKASETPPESQDVETEIFQSELNLEYKTEATQLVAEDDVNDEESSAGEGASNDEDTQSSNNILLDDMTSGQEAEAKTSSEILDNISDQKAKPPVRRRKSTVY
ncbi:MAG: hypothetical protein EBS06_03535 [Proteobacteria bacterium]|nr:hypothetical protein [Pseudomonadota bacterium]